MTNDLSHGSAADGACPEIESPMAHQPHPRNAQFLAAATAQIMQTFAMHMHSLVDGHEAEAAARCLEEVFWCELGLPAAPEGRENVPRFLLPKEYQLEQHLEKAQIAQTVAAFDLPQLPKRSYVATNLRMLCQQLHLGPVEHHVLLWSYCVTRSVVLLPLAYATVTSAAHRIEVLAKQFQQPASAVERCFAPYRLLALGLMDPITANRTAFERPHATLNKVFQGTYRLIQLLETPHRTRGDLLNHVLEPSHRCDLLTEYQLHHIVLGQQLPEPMARIYAKAVHYQPLSRADITAIVDWYLQIEIQSHVFAELAGHLDFIDIRNAIQRCCFDCCQAGVPISTFRLMQAFYAVAK